MYSDHWSVNECSFVHGGSPLRHKGGQLTELGYSRKTHVSVHGLKGLKSYWTVQNNAVCNLRGEIGVCRDAHYEYVTRLSVESKFGHVVSSFDSWGGLLDDPPDN